LINYVISDYSKIYKAGKTWFKKMVKKLAFVSFVLISVILMTLMLSVAYAYETPFVIKTGEDYNVTIRTLNAEGDTVDSFYATSNSWGEARLSVSTTASTFSIYLLVENQLEGKIASYGKYENLGAGEEITIDAATGKIVPKVVEPVVDTTIEENITEEVVEDTSEIVAETTFTAEEVVENDTKEGLLSGMAVFSNFSSSIKNVGNGIKNVFNKKAVYIILAIIVIGGVAFFVFKQINGKKMQPLELLKYAKPIRPIKLEDEKEIAVAEKKLKAALEEVEKLKNKRKEIEDAEREFEAARVKLERLKKE